MTESGRYKFVRNPDCLHTPVTFLATHTNLLQILWAAYITDQTKTWQICHKSKICYQFVRFLWCTARYSKGRICQGCQSGFCSKERISLLPNKVMSGVFESVCIGVRFYLFLSVRSQIFLIKKPIQIKSSKELIKKEKIKNSAKGSGGDRRADKKRRKKTKIFLFFERNMLST